MSARRERPPSGKVHRSLPNVNLSNDRPGTAKVYTQNNINNNEINDEDIPQLDVQGFEYNMIKPNTYHSSKQRRY